MREDPTLYARERLETRHRRIPLEDIVPLSTPIIIFIDPCGACNIKCNFCPCNKAHYRDDERHKIMSLDLFKKAVDDMAEFPDPIKVVNVYGFGEPLLNPQTPEMIAYLKSKKVTNEIRIVSNGILLNPKLNQELVDAGVDLIRISVEAMTSEQYKEIAGANIDMNKFLENFADLYNRSRGKARLSAKITNATFYNKEDFDHFFDMFDKITDFMMVQNVAGTWSEFEEMVMPEKALPARFNGNVVTETQVLCAYPVTSMMIHSNGVVGMCPQDWKFLTQYGDVRKKSLKEIWASKFLRNIQIMHMEGRKKEIEFCKNCICIGDDHPDKVGKLIAQKLREA